MSIASDFISKMKKAGDVVGENVAGVVEKSKVGYSIMSAEAELDDLFKSLGKAVYNASKDDADPELADSIVDRIDKKMMAIKDLRERSAAVRKVIICDKCEAENPNTSNYCSVCGAKLEKPEAAPQDSGADEGPQDGGDETGGAAE